METENQLVLRVGLGTDAGEQELDSAMRLLRQELLSEGDIERVDFVDSGPAPTGTKALGAIDWGSLLLTLATSGGVVTRLVDVLKAWLDRDKNRSLTLSTGDMKLVLKGASRSEIDNALRAVLAKKKIKNG